MNEDAKRDARRSAGAYAAVAAMAFLPFLRGVLGGSSFYFRDLGQAFFPLRMFALAGLRAGELRYWNPYVHEGIPTPFPPLSYPVELLQLLRPDETGISALLALHVPLAAIALMALARSLGASRTGAAAGALVYALGGFTLSSLNFYVYLHAIAWAPLVVLTLRRASSGGRRAVALAAACTAIAVSTVGVEVVLQAVLVGIALSEWRARGAAPRLAASLALAAGLAAPTIAAMAAVTAVGQRAQGFDPSVVLAQSVHPLTLVQVVIGDWYGDLTRLTDRWWGANFFPNGFPYILSLYLGAPALALAAAGATERHPLRPRLVALAALFTLLALGRWAGLRPIVEAIAPLRSFRYPTKLFFTVHLSVALLAALGADALGRGARRAAAWVAAASGAAGGVLVLLPLLPRLAPGFVAWFLSGFLPPGTALEQRTAIGAHVAADAAAGGAIALLVMAVALAARSSRLRPSFAALLVGGLVCGDLLRTGASLNPMVTSAFWAPSAEVEAMLPVLRDGARTYSCNPERSAAYWRARVLRRQDHEVWTFAALTDTLTPHANMRVAVPTALSEDVTSLVPRAAVPPEDASCQAFDALLPRLRAASVGHVLSLDPISSSGARLVATVTPARLAPLAVSLYAVDGARPWLASVPDGSAAVSLAAYRPGAIDLDVDAPSPARVAVREGGPLGWTARVDGMAAAIAAEEDGRHLLVAVPAGRSRVSLRYAPPRLPAACALAILSLIVAAWGGRRASAQLPGGPPSAS